MSNSCETCCKNGQVKRNSDDFFDVDSRYNYEEISKIADYLCNKVTIKPKLGIICGTGLGSMADAVNDAQSLDYKDIPNFPVSTVKGHKGKLIFGTICDVPVMCLQGRFHFYEGYPLSTCVMPVRLMKLMGVTHLIASNAAGGLNPNFKIGDIMIIKDHVNFMGFAGNHPLRGHNDSRFGTRFFPMRNAYDPSIIADVKRIAQELDVHDTVHEGIYTCLGGPNYETIAELKCMSLSGVDAVGMSTVHEVITAKHCNIICFAFSLITNICVTDYSSNVEPNGDEVLDIGKMKENDVKVFVTNIINHIGRNYIK